MAVVVGLFVVVLGVPVGVATAERRDHGQRARGRGSRLARVRMLTSLTFAIASIVSGFIYDRTGYQAAFVIGGVSVLLIAVSAA